MLPMNGWSLWEPVLLAVERTGQRGREKEREREREGETRRQKKLSRKQYRNLRTSSRRKSYCEPVERESY